MMEQILDWLMTLPRLARWPATFIAVFLCVTVIYAVIALPLPIIGIGSWRLLVISAVACGVGNGLVSATVITSWKR